MFESIRKAFRKESNVALLVDGPNTLRKAFHLDIKQIKEEVAKYGRIRIAKIYLDQFASDKLIEAMINQGFDVEITTGDVDVTMAIEAMEYALDPDIDTVALTREVLLALAKGIAEQGAGLLPEDMLGSLTSQLSKLGALSTALVDKGGKLLDTGKDIGGDAIKGAGSATKGITDGIKGLLKPKEDKE